jgi:hypothetical protein
VQDVTLLLTPDQAQRVALATGDGRIQLALRNPLDKEAAEPLLVVRSELYEGPTMETSGNKSKSKPAAEKPEAKKAAGKGKSSGTAPASAKVVKKPAATPAPPPPPQTVSAQRMVEIELIQGSKRSKSAFEEENPESTETSTQPDGMNQ